GGPAAPPRGDATPDRGRDAPRARPDPVGGRRPHAPRDREGRRQGARPGRPAAPDRGSDRRSRLLRPGRGQLSVAHRTYARALYQAAKERDRLPQVREELADFVEAIRTVPELHAVLRNPQIDRRAKGSA